MKVLTVKSPYAQQIIREGKYIENRSWNTLYRGSLLIHVSQSPLFPESGFIIGVVDLIDCQPPGSLFTMGNKWAIGGLYHWILSNPRELKKPIPAKGNLSLWNYEIDIEELNRLL